MIYVSGGMSVVPVLCGWKARLYVISELGKTRPLARRNEPWRVGVLT